MLSPTSFFPLIEFKPHSRRALYNVARCLVVTRAPSCYFASFTKDPLARPQLSPCCRESMDQWSADALRCERSRLVVDSLRHRLLGFN
jgi:hypothetical protein